ncbi:MAG: hypothetical protein ACYC09_08275 [Bacteroidota bacterium]
MICPHCKSEIHQPGAYCSNCGGIITQLADAHNPSAHYTPSGIFSDQELKLLLDINRKAVSGDDKNASVSQSDIDKLFG